MARGSQAAGIEPEQRTAVPGITRKAGAQKHGKPMALWIGIGTQANFLGMINGVGDDSGFLRRYPIKQLSNSHRHRSNQALATMGARSFRFPPRFTP